jgi:hypothetical protein
MHGTGENGTELIFIRLPQFAEWADPEHHYGTPTFIFKSRFHDPRSNGRPPREEAFNKGSTPASSVMAVTREGSSLSVHDKMTASPAFNSDKDRGGSFSIIV